MSYAGLWGQHRLDTVDFIAKAAELGYSSVMLMGKRPHLSPLDANDAALEAIRAASRFLSVYNEYVKAPEVTRKRMYLETMETVLGGMNKVILDGVSGTGGQGVLPYLPLDALRPGTPPAGGN